MMIMVLIENGTGEIRKNNLGKLGSLRRKMSL
jgi:hypothetical protein